MAALPQSSILNPLLVNDSISDQLDQMTIDFRDNNLYLIVEVT